MATWRAVPVLVLLAALLIGCTRDGSSSEAFCRRLADVPPGSPWADTDFIVYLDPDVTDEETAAVRARLDATDEVDGYTWVTQDEAFDEFVELNRDRPELYAAIGPDLMPANARVRVKDADPAIARAAGGGFESEPGVYRVVYRDELNRSVIDLSVRPLTIELSQQMQAFTQGRTSIQLAEVAPDELRDAAQVLDTFWADPGRSDGTASRRVVDAARQITAHYDTECE